MSLVEIRAGGSLAPKPGRIPDAASVESSEEHDHATKRGP